MTWGKRRGMNHIEKTMTWKVRAMVKYHLLREKYLAFVTVVLLVSLWTWKTSFASDQGNSSTPWAALPQTYPVDSFTPIPQGDISSIPRIQAHFQARNATEKAKQQQRLEAVRSNFTYAWTAYKTHAWLFDEARPLSGWRRRLFPGWGVTLVESLDTLWLMGMKEDFEGAVKAVSQIDFSVPRARAGEFDVHHITMMYLGGLLSGYEVSGKRYPVLLRKATQLGHLLYHAFDTPNRMPVTHWDPRHKLEEQEQYASATTNLAHLAGLSVQFTRLSQLTGDPRWYDAIQRVNDFLHAQQNSASLSGMWPHGLNAQDVDATASTNFTAARSAVIFDDVTNVYILLGGHEQYSTISTAFTASLKKSGLFRPLLPLSRQKLALAPYAHIHVDASNVEVKCETDLEQASCALGASFALSSRLFTPRDPPPFSSPIEQLNNTMIATAITRTCTHLSAHMPHGILPSSLSLIPCPNARSCPWDRNTWLESISCGYIENLNIPDSCAKGMLLPAGVKAYQSRSYDLSAELAKSLFYMYRITGEETWRDTAWKLFEAVVKATKAKYGFARLANCIGQEDTEIEILDDALGPDSERRLKEELRFEDDVPRKSMDMDDKGTGDTADGNSEGLQIVQAVDVDLSSFPAVAVSEHDIDSDVLSPPASDDNTLSSLPQRLRKRKDPELLQLENSHEQRSKVRRQVVQKDKMESNFLGETLKYFWLIFSDEDVGSLDEWVWSGGHGFRWRENASVPK